MEKTVIAALYQFKNLTSLEIYKQTLLTFCKDHDIVGTLLLANEGINGTIAGSRQAVDGLKQLLLDLGFDQMEYKESFADKNKVLFYRMKVKIKKEIVTMRVENLIPEQHRGLYLSPTEWHKLIQQPDVVILDTRNHYEYMIGTFKNAINPNTQCFADFPAFLEAHRDAWKNKTIAMFCTGGIRCEKSTSYAVTTGIGKQVYHLKGGILKYLEEIPESEGLWQGECFVFDYRVSVGYGLVPGNYQQCYACRMPLNSEEQSSPFYSKGVSCPYCYGKTTEQQLQSFSERKKQIELGQCSFK